MTTFRRGAFVFASAIAGLALVGCAGKQSRSTALVCTGTLQKVGKPETAVPSPPAAVRITKFPDYVKLWSKSYGEVSVSEPFLENYTHVQQIDDHLFLRKMDDKEEVSGVFNRISGHFTIHFRDDFYELNCKPTEPLAP